MSLSKLFLCWLLALGLLVIPVLAPVSAAPLGSRPLEVGASGEDVAELQKNLTAAGFYRGPVSGYYGDLTLAAVVAFQKAAQLPAQGYVGKLTVSAIKAKLKPPKPKFHNVAPGETLGDIATAYQLTIAELAKFNGLKNPNFLSVGQRLSLEPPPPVKTASVPVSSGPTDTSKPKNDAPLIVFRAKEIQTQPQPPVPTKTLALTFDDGPDPVLTPKVLELLKKHNFRATFFVIGSQAEQYPDIVRRVISDGHEIASHSYHHQDLTQLSAKDLEAEFSRASQVISQITGKPPTWFRPPTGTFNDQVINQAAKSNQRLALWTNIGPQDIPGPVLIRRVLSSAREGAVILLHDNRQATVEVLEPILANLQRLGFRSMTLTELVGTP